MLTAIMVVVMEPVLPLMRAHFAASENVDLLVRLAATSASIGVVFGMPAAGWVIGRIGRKPVLLFGLALFGLAGMAPLIVQTLPEILASRVAVGVGLGAALTAMLTLVGDFYSPSGRAKLLAAQAIIGAISIFGFAAASGIIAHASGWRAPFVLFAAALALALVALFAIREPPRATSEAGQGSLSRSDLLGPWIGGVALLLLLANLATFTYLTQMPFLLDAMGAGDPRTIGLITGGPAAIAALLAAIGLPILAARAPAQRVFGWMLIGLALSMAIAAFASAPAALAAAGFLAMLAPSLLAPWANLTAMTAAPVAARSMALAIVGSFASIGQFIAPLVTQPMAGGIGLPATLLLIGGVCALVGLPLAIAAGGLRVSGDKPLAAAAH